MKHLLLISLLFLTLFTQAQNDRFKTMHGHIFIVGEADGHKVVGESFKLQTLLDAGTKEFILYLNVADLSTGIDSLDAMIPEIGAQRMEYKGSFGIAGALDINEVDRIEVDGYLTINGIEQPLALELQLDHMYGGPNSNLMISSTFELRLSDFGLQSYFPQFDDLIQVQFGELILRGH